MKRSKPAVFMIESLRFSDEKNKLLEGELISKMLFLNDIECDYFYFRTQKEFVELLKLFKKSTYRYFHLSCHGSQSEIEFTLDVLSYKDFSKLLNGYLEDKRLFISACAAVNEQLSNTLFPKCRPISLIGPVEDIEFRDAAILWASFYHLMFKIDNTAMKQKNIAANLQNVVNLFKQPLNFFYRAKTGEIKHSIIEVEESDIKLQDLLVE